MCRCARSKEVRALDLGATSAADQRVCVYRLLPQSNRALPEPWGPNPPGGLLILVLVAGLSYR